MGVDGREKLGKGEWEEEVELNEGGNQVSVVSLVRLTLLLLKEGGVLASAGEIRLSSDCEKEKKQPAMMSHLTQTSATSFLSRLVTNMKEERKDSQIS